MRTEFARVYVLVNVCSLDLWYRVRGEGRRPRIVPLCQVGKWVICHDILPGRSLRVTVSAGPFMSRAFDELKCVLKRNLRLT
jgi:hypothetical protein